MMKYPALLERCDLESQYTFWRKLNDNTSAQSQVGFATNVLIPEMKRVGLQMSHLPNGFAIGTLPITIQV